MHQILPRLLAPLAVVALAACAGKQHVAPPTDSPTAATVYVSGPMPGGMAVTKFNLNRKQCYQGLTPVPEDAAAPMRIASGELSFFSAKYDRGGTLCEVIVSFSPEPQASYALVPERQGAILGGGSCAMTVRRVMPGGTSRPEPVEGWVMRSASVACVRPQPAAGRNR